MSFSFCRIHGSPCPRSASAWTLRPGFVRSVMTCSQTHQMTGNISRPCQPRMSIGISPTVRPAITTSWVGARSMAISAPVLPAPTSSTGPGWSWAGLR